MKSKTKLRPKTKRANTPPPPRNFVHVTKAGGQNDPCPQLWIFNHTHPLLPGSIHCVVRAPNITEARGVAYLLAENFHQNIIGFLKAQSPTQRPGP